MRRQSKGRIVVWTCGLALALASVCAQTAAAAPVAAPAAGDPQAGRKAFAKCASCHQVNIPRSSFGPHLHGVIGRPAAAATDFRYSEAMRNSRIVWSEDALRTFLRAPDKAVPGTSMRFRGISKEQEIDDLLAYLRSVP